MRVLVGVLVIGVAVCLASKAAIATVLTFDDLPVPDVGGAALPAGYGGFNWGSVAYHSNTDAGYRNGCVSGTQDAFNFAESIATVSGQPFDFVGAYFTGAWNDGLNINITGYRGATIAYDQTIVASYYYPTWFPLNYYGIDRLTFRSFGGQDLGHGLGQGTHFVMDDFTFTPEPATLSLLALGGLLIARRRA